MEEHEHHCICCDHEGNEEEFSINLRLNKESNIFNKLCNICASTLYGSYLHRNRKYSNEDLAHDMIQLTRLIIKEIRDQNEKGQSFDFGDYST